MTTLQLQETIERLAKSEPIDREACRDAVAQLRQALELGSVRAAQPTNEGTWQVNPWVKQGILLGFKVGDIVAMEAAGPMEFYDKDTWPVRRLGDLARFRTVPGGTSVRAGSYLGSGVTIMPPAYVNVGAWVGDNTMIDSHALVGSCAQVGSNVHLSAAAQIGGVLEPIGAMPVIIEDDVMVGGGTGVYEGTRVCARAVLAAGVILTRSHVVYDLVRECTHRAEPDGVLTIPSGAVVVPGSRPAKGAFAQDNGLTIATPVIVKYRDARTDAATALEEALR